jgi:nucleotide-binding universal stress UspA family protein
MNAAPSVFQKILVATDFSESARAALAQAFSLAKATGAALTLAHAIPMTRETMEGLVANPWYAAASVEDIERRLRHGADERLDEHLAPFQDQGVTLHHKTLWGTPFIEMIHAVQEDGYDLAVVGTRGLSPVSRFLVGSTAAKLARKCPCPVWIAKPRLGDELHSILAPIDFSDASRKSLQLAASLAAETGSSLHVLYVLVEEPEFDLLPFSPDIERSQRQRLLRRRAVTLLKQFVDDSKLPTPTSLHVERGEVSRRIVATGRRLDVDLTVMGTVGRGGFSGLITGNTAERVLQAIDRPLLAVKSDNFVSPIPARPAALHA